MLPHAFTITAVLNCLSHGKSSFIKCSTPGFWSPIAFNIPAVVSQTRGGLFPGRGFSEVPFVTIPPNLFKSIYSANSLPYPNVPDATVIGFFILIPAKLTSVFI